MPFVLFTDDEMHTKALDMIMQVQLANESLPLEQRLTAIISSFEGNNPEPHNRIYFFPMPYILIFRKAHIYHRVIDPQEVNNYLSKNGRYNLQLVRKYSPAHIGHKCRQEE